ncbi:ClpP/crotonase [Plenodomus tracheiphilus IPT5]|uniref:ClpP/crotonase n=1 Tax=Plenodomus tracheiphilus IPT5 TaxID=1408161 RepID=A0A6A7ATV5_9PLEO|nr:ClpP/crotonase [Plenodomus tracheiphilus IPT5]
MEPPSYDYVKVELEESDHIAVIKYNRPKSGNSLLPQLVSEMLAALRWADQNPDIRIIVQTGEGRFFCTGMELMDTQTPMPFGPNSDFHQLNKTLIECKKILIAAVNGPAAGYGVSSLALFDLVYSVPDAYFFTPFVKWGMAPEGASSYTFAKIMGHQKAAALCLAGDRISAEEADKLGLVTKILPRDGFRRSVLEIAGRLARAPQGSLRATKALMKQPVLQALLDANDRECEIIGKERYGSAEFTEAVAQFKVEQNRKSRSSSKL